MKNIKSHFVFTKQQRSGIFVLLLLIVVLQCVYFFVDFDTGERDVVDVQIIAAFQSEVDSLALAAELKKHEIRPYNPNFITDYKGYVLGMSVVEIDRLHSFRKQNKYVNSSKEFQQITKISDSLLGVLSPKFKFPDWVVKKNLSKTTSLSYQKDINKAQVKDIHLATSLEYKLAYRVINFRDKLGGFLSIDQFKDVYGVSVSDVVKLNEKFVIKTIPEIKKININLAVASELSSLVYINDYIAANIIDERILREGFKELDELRYVAHFPVEKLDRIKLYLTIGETQQ